jgi:hypothetical protein
VGQIGRHPIHDQIQTGQGEEQGSDCAKRIAEFPGTRKQIFMGFRHDSPTRKKTMGFPAVYPNCYFWNRFSPKVVLNRLMANVSIPSIVEPSVR